MPKPLPKNTTLSTNTRKVRAFRARQKSQQMTRSEIWYPIELESKIQKIMREKGMSKKDVLTMLIADSLFKY